MITDKDLEDLPSDPDLAFLAIESLCRARLSRGIANTSNATRIKELNLEYLSSLIGFGQELNIGKFSKITIPPASNENERQDVFNSVNTEIARVRIRSLKIRDKNSVRLIEADKVKIRYYVEQIKTVIDGADLSVEKADALHDKLNAFLKELDKTRTSLQAGMTVFVAICGGIGAGIEKLEPARKWIDSIAALLGAAKEAEDLLSLPAPEDQKRIEGPTSA